MVAQYTEVEGHTMTGLGRLRRIAAAVALCALAFGVSGIESADATITNVTSSVRFDCYSGMLVAYAPEARGVIGNQGNARIDLYSRVQRKNGSGWTDYYTTDNWAYAYTTSFRGLAGYGLSLFPNTNQTWISTGAIPSQHPAAGQMFNYATPWVNIYNIARGYTYRVLTLFFDRIDRSFSWVVNRTTTGAETCSM